MNQAPTSKTAIIIGAGPAGLTAAYELLRNSPMNVLIFEMTGDLGGIAKTVNYKDNRIDIGGHRFFSKSERVMNWWQKILPLDHNFKPQNSHQSDRELLPILKDSKIKSMIVRERLSRIFFLRKFFDYPISLSFQTLKQLSLKRIFKIGLGYIKVQLMPIKNEKNLEDFFINRFGNELYLTFFKSYTEKVWGVPCTQIKPEWGAQRIKGLSITKAIWHALKSTFKKDHSVEQKNTETSLIENFLYPKLGPGQMWEEVARLVKENSGNIYFYHQVLQITHDKNLITEVKIKNLKDNSIQTIKANYVISTMPIKDLINGFDQVPLEIKTIANGLVYRDFMTLGLLLNKLKIKNSTKIKTLNNLVPDNWIYIQEEDVKVGRLQIFNNWSPYMVADPNKVWIGLEYFCNEGDDLWNLSDEDFFKLGVDELKKIDIIHKDDVLDKVVIRMPKAYPAYFGSYDKLSQVTDYLNQFSNLFLIGRNGMHRYNNQDHSMLTAMAAVENILAGVLTKDNIWNVNAEQDYHEEK